MLHLCLKSLCIYVFIIKHNIFNDLLGPMPPQLPPFGQLPPMMGRPQVSMPSSGQPMGPVSGTSTGPTGFAQAPQSVPSGQFSNIPPPGHFGSPATTGFQNNPTMPPNYMEASSYNQVSAPQQPFSANAQSKVRS